MINPYNILRHELTGLQATVVYATHEGYKCSGQIVGETRNTIKIRHQDKVKILPKDAIVFELDLPMDCKVRVEGKLLLARPVDRIKKKYRIKFM